MVFKDIVKYCEKIQQTLCQDLASFEFDTKFVPDIWESALGRGQTNVLSQGQILERSAVNISIVAGSQLPPATSERNPELAGLPFQAVGLSTITHPLNPFIPTSHMNIRYIQVEAPHGQFWWFGGGFDLTPYYIHQDDIILWHQAAKHACDTLSPTAYSHFKPWCDRYFYLPHRQETRGVGGLFFDDLRDFPQEHCFTFIKAVVEAYTRAYTDLIERYQAHQYTEQQRDFQLYRRGRYVEFNLLYDRGTHFGLQSGGRTESILVSMPPVVHWHYKWQDKPGSAEHRLKEFLQPRDWLTESAVVK